MKMNASVKPIMGRASDCLVFFHYRRSECIKTRLKTIIFNILGGRFESVDCPGLMYFYYFIHPVLEV